MKYIKDVSIDSRQISLKKMEVKVNNINSMRERAGSKKLTANIPKKTGSFQAITKTIEDLESPALHVEKVGRRENRQGGNMKKSVRFKNKSPDRKKGIGAIDVVDVRKNMWSKENLDGTPPRYNIKLNIKKASSPDQKKSPTKKSPMKKSPIKKTPIKNSPMKVPDNSSMKVPDQTDLEKIEEVEVP